MKHDGRPFTLGANVNIPGLITGDPKNPIDKNAILAALATIELKDAPTSLAALIPMTPAAPTPGSPAPLTAADLAMLAENAIGPTVSLKLTTAQTTGKGTMLDATLTAAQLTGKLGGTIAATATGREVLLTAITAESRLTPAMQRAILPRFIPDPAALPELTQSATVTLTVDPITIPLTPDLKPDLASAKGDLVATIAVPGQLLVRVPMTSVTSATTTTGAPAQASAQPLGPVGARDLTAKAKLPLKAALGAAGERGVLDVNITGQALRDRGGAPVEVGTIAATIQGEVSDLNPASTFRITAGVRQFATAFLDELAGKPGYATGALGENVTLETRLTLSPPANATWASLAQGSINAEADITSPRLKSTKPLKIDVQPDRIALREPSGLTWAVDPAFANIFLAPPPAASTLPSIPGRPPEQPAVRITKPVAVTVTLDKLAISKAASTSTTPPSNAPAASPGSVPAAPTVGPFKPGIFDLALGLTAPTVEMTAKDGTTTTLTGLNVTAGRQDNGVRFNVALDEARTGAETPGQGAKGIKLAGNVADLADASGNVNANTATLTALGELPAVPTIVLDTLAAQNGLLVEALGPVTTVKIDANKFGKSGGKLTATASSARATFDLAGLVQNNVLVNAPSTAMKVNVTEITQDLSKRLVKGLPLFGSVQKPATARPASITGTNLKIPLDNDLAKLDGDFAIDPGEINFEIAGDFANIVATPLLNAAKANSSGTAFAKLQPMHVSIRSGVASLTRWSVPVGEFNIQMDGTVNLATGEINFVTYFPAGALALEKLNLKGPVGSIAGDILKNAVIPVRTQGMTTARKTEVDGDAAAKELFKGIDPGKIIDLFKPKPKDPPPAPAQPK